MYTIKTMNKIAKVGLDNFGTDYTVTEETAAPDAILVRSASLHEMEIPASLKAIARAGAGTNNIPLDKCAENGVVVFNTPGANANAVKELVITGMLISSRKVIDAIDWAKTLKGKGDEVGKLVEKGKSQFAGPEIKGKTLGVIGLGAIGALVANAAIDLGMNVIGYDPFLSVTGAFNLSSKVEYTSDLDKIFTSSDYITLHVPLTDKTRGVVCAESIAKMKDGVRILNFARGELVSGDILEALANEKVACYVTDFPNDTLIGEKGVIAIPHL
ncbi:MAG: 3-phosphoglycerate dehydrogenase, partial [Oscillospiraceae bacterium]